MLRAWLTALAALLAGAGLVAVLAAQERVSATEEIATVLQPLSVDATELYRSLAAADATVTSGFLSPGFEPAESLRQYDRSIASASGGIARAAGQATDDATAERIAQLGAQLPVYTGLIEQARANNRRGLPLGTAYLRRASELMQTSMLPAAEAVQNRQAELLDDAHRRAGAFPWAALVAALLVLAALILAQVWLAFRFHRVLNRGLVLATLAVLIGVLWWTVAGIGAGTNLERAQAHSDTLSDALGPAQVAAFQARAAETLSLVQRDGGANEQTFADRMQRLSRDGGRGGALGAATRLTPDQAGRDRVRVVVERAKEYAWAHALVRAADADGRYADAVRLAISDQPEGAAVAFRALDESLAAEDVRQQAGFAESITAAQAWRAGLVPGTAVLALLAVLGALLGIGARLGEYR